MELIVIGLVISYLCWITKKEYRYIEKKSIENSAMDLKQRKEIINKEAKQANKLSYKLLTLGIYFGFIVSSIGIIFQIIKLIK